MSNIQAISPSVSHTNANSSDESLKIVRGLIANEIIFAVVGPIGSGTSTVANSLFSLLEGQGYKTAIVKASEIIKAWAIENKLIVDEKDAASLTSSLQDIGDKMRESDPARIAMYFATYIRDLRAKNLGKDSSDSQAVEPDGQKRAYIIDSLRNPAEVALLRHVYQESFCLIGVIASENTRKNRLTKKYSSVGSDKIRELMERDEKAESKHGQQVSDTFHLADFFIDNDTERLLDNKKPNPEWVVSEDLGRLVDTLKREKISLDR